VALAAGADGVHVGAEDLPVAEVRRVVGPQMIVGATARTLVDARAAIAAGADYVASGPSSPSTKRAGVEARACDARRGGPGLGARWWPSAASPSSAEEVLRPGSPRRRRLGRARAADPARGSQLRRAVARGQALARRRGGPVTLPCETAGPRAQVPSRPSPRMARREGEPGRDELDRACAARLAAGAAGAPYAAPRTGRERRRPPGAGPRRARRLRARGLLADARRSSPTGRSPSGRDRRRRPVARAAGLMTGLGAAVEAQARRPSRRPVAAVKWAWWGREIPARSRALEAPRARGDRRRPVLQTPRGSLFEGPRTSGPLMPGRAGDPQPREASAVGPAVRRRGADGGGAGLPRGGARVLLRAGTLGDPADLLWAGERRAVAGARIPAAAAGPLQARSASPPLACARSSSRRRAAASNGCAAGWRPARVEAGDPPGRAGPGPPASRRSVEPRRGHGVLSGLVPAMSALAVVIPVNACYGRHCGGAHGRSPVAGRPRERCSRPRAEQSSARFGSRRARSESRPPAHAGYGVMRLRTAAMALSTSSACFGHLPR
jgi:hypothetical protein